MRISRPIQPFDTRKVIGNPPGLGFPEQPREVSNKDQRLIYRVANYLKCRDRSCLSGRGEHKRKRLTKSSKSVVKLFVPFVLLCGFQRSPCSNSATAS